MLLQISHQFGQHAKITAKSLQSQFGQKCDIKKAGNTYPLDGSLQGIQFNAENTAIKQPHAQVTMAAK
ncbi:hypothetical protein CA85_52880 [Allorhodopirellula solitaria]|uniref:Uncharacterized protein n=2 Tax=Allorhodopirellula solitaria TaxID=2527987 RepID=A0A5C5WJG1_9BACT|nr:hypothetical protein CA85_52880 [Allorhodopirellula solitaria]